MIGTHLSIAKYGSFQNRPAMLLLNFVPKSAWLQKLHFIARIHRPALPVFFKRFCFHVEIKCPDNS